MKDLKALRQEIISKTVDYYQEKFAGKTFIAGKTRVNYAGRVFDIFSQP